eukprot:SAG31_NODE_30236_length_383_cov_13.866197_1_plen_71_part_10
MVVGVVARQNATEMPKWPIIICPHHRTTLGRDNQQPPLDSCIGSATSMPSPTPTRHFEASTELRWWWDRAR